MGEGAGEPDMTGSGQVAVADRLFTWPAVSYTHLTLPTKA